MKRNQCSFIVGLKRRTRWFAGTVASLCLALTGVIGCNGPASIADVQKAESGPVRQHPENLHYFSYKGKPLVLITTDQHYGAVINLDFDYVPFLDRLHEYGVRPADTASTVTATACSVSRVRGLPRSVRPAGNRTSTSPPISRSSTIPHLNCTTATPLSYALSELPRPAIHSPQTDPVPL